MIITSLHLQNGTLLIAALINIVMSVIVFSRGVKNKINLYFGLLTFFNFLWVIGMLIGRVLTLGMFWYYAGALLIYPIALGIAIFLYYFCISFPMQIKRLSNLNNLLVILPAIVMSIIVYMKGWFILSYYKDIVHTEYTLYVNKLPYSIYSLYFIVLVILALKELHKKNVALYVAGDLSQFSAQICAHIKKAEALTCANTGLKLIVAVNYGGQWDIVQAAQRIAEQVATGVLTLDQVDEKLFSSYLDTKDQPYPYVDLFIRTSGEQRTSGLMPWQMEYAEYYFEADHLPDFTPEKLRDAILDYSRRRRRFGGNDAEQHLTFDPKVVARLEIAWWRLRKIPKGTRFQDYALNHLREQFGLSKKLAKEAARYLIVAFLEQDNGRNWEKAKTNLKKFYALLRDEVKLAFEPSIVASMQVKFWEDMAGKEQVKAASDAEETARELVAEVHRISLFQAAKAAHLLVLANIERNLAERGSGEKHWDKAQDYLERFYRALKERVA